MSEKLILGIETSCDDTSICLLKGNAGSTEGAEVLSLLSFSQELLLKKFGGVVPEIAARHHSKKIPILLEECFNQAGVKPNQLDAISVTTNPGLLGPLLTGLNAAKTLSLYNQTPIIAANHLYAHLQAIHLTEKVTFPFLGLLVSGGHSLYLLVNSLDDYQVIGSTIDDAAGEAFDKGGKLLGLGYPAGRIIDELAKAGDAKRFSFPIGLKQQKNAMLSYSGVKTSLRLFAEKNKDLNLDPKDPSQDLKDVCASYQHAIVSALELKLKNAINMIETKNLPIVVGGGVACNSYLRQVLKKSFKDVYIVAPKYCTDNAAMIANYGILYFDQAINYPECLQLDARNRFIEKTGKDYVQKL